MKAEIVSVPEASALRSSSPLEAFGPDVAPTEVSRLYQAGLALVALGMVLLPVCYVALIGLTGFLTWYHLTHGFWILGNVGGITGGLIYVAPIIGGGTLIAFMLKPLFAKRPPPPVTYTLEREKEPLLFGFIEQVCKLVRAPAPKRVDVNCEVNASAGFRRGLLSVAGNDLVLTIGLPLAGGLNMREFAGVLAHEFGHFAQGAGMRLSYVIRHINLWFARVVYDPDQWDQKLERAARGKDYRIAAVLLVARGAIWLTRRMLGALMKAGHAISCFMLRQMEYDADSYECKVAGSDAFEATMARLRTLSLAAQTAFGDMRESWRSGRLPEDFPDFVNRKASVFPPEAQQQLQRACAATKTKVFDTHPADADRVRAAQAINAPGVFRLTDPAAGLFADFPRLCKDLTRFFYEKQQHLPVRDQNLVGNDESLKESAANLQVQRALHGYLHGINTGFALVKLSPDQMAPLPDWRVSARNLRSARERLANAAPQAQQALKEHTNADAVWIKGASAHHLLQCGFAIPIQQFGLPAATLAAAKANLDFANSAMDRNGAALGAFAQAASGRLAAALQLLQEPSVAARIEGAGALHQEAVQLVRALAALGQASEALHKARRRLPGLELLLNNRKNHKEPAKVDRQIASVAGELKGLLQLIQSRIQPAPYPFQHARGQISVAEYARTDGKYANEVQAIYCECQAHLDRLFSLYYRILGRLVVIAEQVENKVQDLPADTP